MHPSENTRHVVLGDGERVIVRVWGLGHGLGASPGIEHLRHPPLNSFTVGNLD